MYLLKSSILLVLLLLPLAGIKGQQQRDTLFFRVMSYNVENLFDTRHDTLKQDHEFLPDALRRWTPHRYYRKLDALARVIAAVGGDRMPWLVGLCEVENDSTLHHLTRRSALRQAGYRYLIAPSPDVRGIDVALLYHPLRFKPHHVQPLAVPKPQPDSRPTRHILYTAGRLVSGDTLHLLVAHFPSRRGGARQTEPYRLAAARTLRHITDSLSRRHFHPNILLMGDFNDLPSSPSIRRVLEAAPIPAQTDDIYSTHLYHLLAQKATARPHYGSYKFQGEWQLIDHLIASGSLLHPNSPISLIPDSADVCTAPFLLTPDLPHGGFKPYSTYIGPRYQGGYSDHLPVWAEFRLIY